MVINSPFEDYDLYGFFVKLAKQIPEGKVASYLDVARAMGDPSSALACAYMQSVLKGSEDVPLHRIVRANGDLGGYYDTEEVRRNSLLLREEGLTVRSGNVKFMKESVFNDFETDSPLEKMKEEQNSLSERVSYEDDFDEDIIAAVDVSYVTRRGYASLAYMEENEPIHEDLVMDANFPYIPGYLFYREYRFVKRLAKGFNGTILIDGNGLLHPRFFGLASETGVCLNKATIGIAKSLLLGRVRRNWVVYRDRKVGYILNRNTIISPGHRVSLDSSVNFIKGKYGNAYPPILRIAHNNTVRLRKERGALLEA